MNIRGEIFDLLKQEQTTINLYDEMKSCLILDDSHRSNDIDIWFRGVIRSLYYESNKYGLVLISDSQGIGKTTFVKHLLPNPDWYSDDRDSYGYIPSIYTNLIIDLTEFDKSYYSKTVSSDGFRVTSYGAEKRLASIVYTTNNVTAFRGSRRSICIYLKDIDRLRYNEIDKEKLWIEIFNRFK